MTASETHASVDETVFEHALQDDERVQHEFLQLSRLLEEINHHPPPGTKSAVDPNWHISDYEVSRWRIVVKGNTRLDRIARFRSELQKRDDIIEARVERFDGGEIAIRLVTTGGIPMGPLDRAVSILTQDGAQITQTS